MIAKNKAFVGRTALFVPSRFLRWFSASRCLIEWLMPFASIRYSTNSYRAVFHHFLARQGHVNARALARWTHSIFRAYGIPYVSFLLSVTEYSIGYQLFLLLPQMISMFPYHRQTHCIFHILSTSYESSLLSGTRHLIECELPSFFP